MRFKETVKRFFLLNRNHAVLRKGFSFVVFAAYFLTSLDARPALAQNLSEYEVKAGFLYQFTQFVDWPVNPSFEDSAPFELCIVGANPFGEVLRSIEVQKVGSHPVAVRPQTNWKDAGTCEMVFISASEQRSMKKILRELSGKPVLTVSETSDFIEQGGMINFTSEGRKIRFEINQQSAERNGLKISSKLLKLAVRVITP